MIMNVEVMHLLAANEIIHTFFISSLFKACLQGRCLLYRSTLDRYAIKCNHAMTHNKARIINAKNHIVNGFSLGGSICVLPSQSAVFRTDL